MTFSQKCKACTFEKKANISLCKKTRRAISTILSKSASLALLGIEEKLLPIELYF